MGGISASLLLLLTAGSGNLVCGQAVVSDEVSRRRDRVIAADETLAAGDKAYLSSNFEEAVVKYREAFALVPAGAKTDKFREAARERYAQAAVQAARVMNRQGNRAAAIDLVDEVLGKSVHPDYYPAQKLRAQLDDAIRTNPSANPDLARKVDEVRRLLYKAEGFHNLGDFDQAINTYYEVLRLDPYNKAARRGMERTQAEISNYATAARDQGRAEMLSQAGSMWELQPGQSELGVSQSGLVGDQLAVDAIVTINQKLDTIILPALVFDENTLEEAIEILEAQARQLDPEFRPDFKGVSIVLNRGSGNSPEIRELLQRRFSLTLTNANLPLRQALEYVARQTGTVYRVDTYAVVFSPAGGVTDDLIVRQYTVPPNFLSQASTAPAAEADPFASSTEAKGGRLAPRLTALEFLTKQGIPFPDGATAKYNAASGRLSVKTSSVGHDQVRALVDALVLEEPYNVIIDTKIIRIKQENLAELSFDVTLQNLVNSGDITLGGGTTGNGRLNDSTQIPEFIVNGIAPLRNGLGDTVTSGLRSGSYAIEGNPIDGIVSASGADASTRGSTQQSAPGFLSLVGIANQSAIAALFRGLEQKKGTDLMTQPSVVTRSGQQAIIESGREFPYPGEYEPPEVPNAIGTTTLIDLATGQQFSPTSFIASPSHPTDFQNRFVGTSLEVQPNVSADRRIAEVAFNLEVDEFLGFINYGEPIQGFNSQAAFGPTGIITDVQEGEITSNDILIPIFDTIRLNTNLVVTTGQTIIAGGVISETVENVEDKVPLLGDIPFLGRMFSSDAIRREKQVVMVFVTVRIVDPAGNPVEN